MTNSQRKPSETQLSPESSNYSFMKITKSFLCIFALFTISIAYSQPKPLPDSIRIELPDQHAIVLFEFREYAADKDLIKQFSSTLTTLNDYLKRSIAESDLSSPHSVTVQEVKSNDKIHQEITIDATTKTKTSVTIKDNAITELLPPGWEINLYAKRYHIYVYVPDYKTLIELMNISLTPAITALDADIQTHVHNRKGLYSRIVLKNDQVIFFKNDHRLPHDMLGLHAGAGVGLFRDKVYPELNFTTAFYFSNRYKPYHYRLNFSYELKFFTTKNTEGNYQSQPASFVTASFATNLRKGRPHWTALGAGYLIHSKTDVFTGKTMKFFLESDIGSDKLNIVPEFYLTNDFKKFAFGLKLNYKF